jgi:hypothetical protein
MTEKSESPIIKPVIDPGYIPEGMTSEKYLEILRIDFVKDLRENSNLYKKPDGLKYLYVGAKMFLLPRGFPVTLLREPSGDIAELREYLFEIGKEFLELEFKEDELRRGQEGKEEQLSQQGADWQKDAIQAAREQRKKADKLNLTDEQLEDQSGETPEAVYLRMKERRLK